MIPSKIGPFKRFVNNPTTMKYGYYYCATFNLPFSKENKRVIRVWLPQSYDFSNPNNRYRVIYFSDGQNLVDRYLSAYGEWNLDETVNRLEEEGYPGLIAVGIDCPKEPIERTKELCPPYEPRKEIFNEEGERFLPFADKYIDFIVNELKPLIDELFFTLSDKEHTGIGGSSMGGIMSYFAYMYRPDIFGFSLSFSPAFFFYKKNRWHEIMDSYNLNPNKNGRLFLYVGGKDFEARFTKPTIETYEYLLNKGFTKSQVNILTDLKEIHHERAWSKYLPTALRFLLK